MMWLRRVLVLALVVVVLAMATACSGSSSGGRRHRSRQSPGTNKARPAVAHPKPTSGLGGGEESKTGGSDTPFKITGPALPKVGTSSGKSGPGRRK